MTDEQGRTASSIPIIDLGADEKTTAVTLREACVEVGFFYLVNHGVSEERVGAVFQQARAFFSQPESEKQKFAATSSQKGYHGWGEETLDPAKQKHGGTKENFQFGPERSAAEAVATAERPFHGPNVWPSVQNLPQFKATMLDYFESMCGVARRLARLMALALQMEADYFVQFFTDPMALLSLLHYDATPSDPDAGVYACGEHTDFDMLTLLKTDNVPGLQIQLKNGVWVDVPPMDGAFIVNIADMLQRWTNDLFRSTRHRVINTSGQERFSMPFFFGANFDARVECLPTCCSADNPAKYEPVVSGKWLQSRYEEIYARMS